MLLEARRRCKRLSAVGAGMGPSPDVLRANVPLQVTGVCEHLLGEQPKRHTGELLCDSAKVCRKRNGVCRKEPFVKQSLPSLYLWAVFTFIVLATVMRHLMSDQVWFPVESLGTLITLVFPLLRVRLTVVLQTGARQKEKPTIRICQIATKLLYSIYKSIYPQTFSNVAVIFCLVFQWIYLPIKAFLPYFKHIF